MIKMIIVCGTPGTGKTTLGRKLTNEGFAVIHLTDFVRKHHLYSNYDEELKSYIINEKAMVSKVLEVQEEMEKKRKTLIVEGVGATLLPTEEVDLCIVLTCDPAEIEARLKKKEYSRLKIEKNLNAENLSVILGDALEKFEDRCVQIDTTTLTERELAEKAIKIIKEELGGETRP